MVGDPVDFKGIRGGLVIDIGADKCARRLHKAALA